MILAGERKQCCSCCLVRYMSRRQAGRRAAWPASVRQRHRWLRCGQWSRSLLGLVLGLLLLITGLNKGRGAEEGAGQGQKRHKHQRQGGSTHHAAANTRRAAANPELPASAATHLVGLGLLDIGLLLLQGRVKRVGGSAGQVRRGGRGGHGQLDARLAEQRRNQTTTFLSQPACKRSAAQPRNPAAPPLLPTLSDSSFQASPVALPTSPRLRPGCDSLSCKGQEEGGYGQQR